MWILGIILGIGFYILGMGLVWCRLMSVAQYDPNKEL